MTITSVLSETRTWALTVTVPTTAASTEVPSQTVPTPSSGPGNEDTARISPLAEALSKLDSGTADHADEVFKKLDADGDGTISEQEFSDNAGKVIDDLRRTRHGHRGHHGHHSGHGQSLDKLFSSIDANDDGKIDKDEIAAAIKKAGERRRPSLNLDRIFKTVDANGDGAISKDELSTALGVKLPQTPTEAPATATGPEPATSASGAAQTTGSIASNQAPSTTSPSATPTTPASSTTAASNAAPTNSPAASAPTGGPASTPAGTTAAAPATTFSFSATFVVSFTAIIQYRSADQASAPSPIGTQLNAAA